MTDLRPRLAYFGSSTAPDGGSERCLYRMVERFHRDYRLTVFLPDEGPLFSQIEELGVDTIDLHFLRLRAYRGTAWLDWWNSCRETRARLTQELRNRQVQLLHCNDLIDLPYVGVAKKVGIPALSHLRLILESRAARAVYRAGIRASRAHVLAVSQAVRQAMLGEGSGLPCRVLYDPAPDPVHFHPREEAEPGERHRLRREWGWGEGDLVVTLVSKLLPNKGHLDFCATAREIERIAPGRFRFLMIAGSTPNRVEYRSEVEAAFEKIPEKSRRWIPGLDHPRVGQALRSSDALLHLPGVPDSFPGVVLEAMACGVPVVAYRVGGIPEQLEGGLSGILVDPGDTKKIAQRVVQLFESENAVKDMRESALKRVRETFSAEKHFLELDRIYRSLLATS
jgi:glycosyltransferase involved in cell wall biosynthesis